MVLFTARTPYRGLLGVGDHKIGDQVALGDDQPRRHSVPYSAVSTSMVVHCFGTASAKSAKYLSGSRLIFTTASSLLIRASVASSYPLPTCHGDG